MAVERLITLLRALSNDAFVSGSDLAERLGLSRASVHLALQGAAPYGIAIERIPGRGYRLRQPISWLDTKRIEAGLRSDWSIELLQATDSTNTQLLAQPARARPVCLAAELQTAGRGRRGRPWQSAIGGSLLFSAAWPFSVDITHLSGLSLVVGLAVAEGLEASGIPRVKLKWPNDLLVDFRKLAGILVEVQAEADSPCRAIIGVGVNVRLPDVVKNDIDQAVVDLSQLSGAEIDRNRLLSAILDALHHRLGVFSEQGFAACRADWDARHAYHLQAVNLIRPNGDTIGGKVVGVSDAGELMLESDAGLQTFTVGELSLRRVTG